MVRTKCRGLVILVVTLIGATCTVVLPAALQCLDLLGERLVRTTLTVCPAEGLSRLREFPVRTLVLYLTRCRVSIVGLTWFLFLTSNRLIRTVRLALLATEFPGTPVVTGRLGLVLLRLATPLNCVRTLVWSSDRAGTLRVLFNVKLQKVFKV